MYPNNRYKKKREIKENLVETTRNGLKICNLTIEIVLNSMKWWDMIHAANSIQLEDKALMMMIIVNMLFAIRIHFQSGFSLITLSFMSGAAENSRGVDLYPFLMIYILSAMTYNFFSTVLVIRWNYTLN